MNPVSAPTTDPSLLLILLAAGVAALGAHVGWAWARRAGRRSSPRSRWGALLVAAASAGTGLSAAAAMALAAEELPFPIGFSPGPVAGIWLGAVALMLPVLLWLASDRRWWAQMGAALLLAALAVATGMAWVLAAGFRPGVSWRQDGLAAATAGIFFGLWLAHWVAFHRHLQDGSWRRLWRLAAAALMAIALVGGLEIVIAAAGLETQKGSIYRKELSGAALTLIFGVPVPLLLAVMAADLAMRRDLQRRPTADSGSANAGRRRRRVRTL
jgi:hypothetical protein